MRQVSASYSPPFPSHFLACCILSCHHVHLILHTCSSHASEHFPRCPFCNSTLICPPAPPFASFHVRVLNILPLDRDLPSGLGSLPVDRLSSFVPFGVRLILQRLMGNRKGLVCVAAQHPSKVAQYQSKPPPSSRSFDHDRVAENRT